MSQIEQAKIERVLRLITLLSGNVGYTITELAERLDTSYRSIYRYIETFKDAGFVVTKDGHGFYHLGQDRGRGRDFADLIHFSDEEAELVNQVLDALDDDNVLKQNLRRKLVSVYNCTSMAKCSFNGNNALKVAALVDAIENKRTVRLVDYKSASSEAVKTYIVEPFAFTTNYVQVWCYDTAAECVKLFRTSRIGSVAATKIHASHTDRHKTGDLDIFRFSGKADKRLRLKMGLLACNLLIEEYPLAASCVTKVKDGEWMLDTMVCSWAGPCRFFVGLMDNIRIYRTPEFRQYVKDFHDTHWKKI